MKKSYVLGIVHLGLSWGVLSDTEFAGVFSAVPAATSAAFGVTGLEVFDKDETGPTAGARASGVRGGIVDDAEVTVLVHGRVSFGSG